MYIFKLWIGTVIIAILIGIGVDWIYDNTFYVGNILIRIPLGTIAAAVLYLIFGERMLKFSLIKTEPEATKE